VLIPGAGWRGVDATARLVTGDTYVSVAVGRDAHDTVAQRCAFNGSSAGCWNFSGGRLRSRSARTHWSEKKRRENVYRRKISGTPNTRKPSPIARSG